MRLPAANPSCCCRGSAEIEGTESSSVLAFCLPSPVASLPRAMLRRFPPMGVYETLFRFAAATHHYMGDPGTHPWAQGFPLTTQIPGGPTLPDSIAIGAGDRM